MCLKREDMFMYGIILTFLHIPTLQGSNRDLLRCNKLEERLNMTNSEKYQYNPKREYIQILTILHIIRIQRAFKLELPSGFKYDQKNANYNFQFPMLT